MPRALRAVANTEDAFLAAVAELPDEYLECRSMQHSWTLVERLRIVDSTTEKGVRAVGGERVYARRTVQCSRCSMQRHDAFRITSRGGHSALRKIGAHYDTSLMTVQYAISGMGPTTGMRDLLLGSMLDAEMHGVTVRRGRPRKAAQ